MRAFPDTLRLTVLHLLVWLPSTQPPPQSATHSSKRKAGKGSGGDASDDSSEEVGIVEQIKAGMADRHLSEIKAEGQDGMI